MQRPTHEYFASALIYDTPMYQVLTSTCRGHTPLVNLTHEYL